VTVRQVGEAIPLARPVLGEAEEQRVLEVLRSGRLSLGPLLGEFERAFASRVGASYGSAVSSGTAGLHLAVRAVGVSDGDEVVTTPLSFVASANVVLYERARPVPLVEDACEALGAVDADGITVGARGHPAVFGFYANKQLTTGEGGMVTVADAGFKERIDSERNQGRAPNMDWLDHDRLGFNYRLSDIACALGLAQLERLDSMLARRARVAGLYASALDGIVGLQLPCSETGRVRRGWFVYVVQLPTGLDRDGIVRALAEHGVPSKPYFPAVHLMTYYRERFGHREGQFPVCEDVAARSIALPFFPEMTESQVERVAEALRDVLGR